MSAAHRHLSAVLSDMVLEQLRETGRYELRGFGVWTLRTRPARRIRNPVTRELMWLDATPEIRFHAAKRLKSAVGGGR